MTDIYERIPNTDTYRLVYNSLGPVRNGPVVTRCRGCWYPTTACTCAPPVERPLELPRRTFGVQTPSAPAPEPWTPSQRRKLLKMQAAVAQQREYVGVPAPPKTLELAVQMQRERGLR